MCSILCSLFESGMSSDVPAPLIDKVNVVADASLDGLVMNILSLV